ncbi:MAG: hypothetical protein ACI9F9_001658 [Candidatus Paceibacteria bacterium]|jgi:hypothetical protein
MESLGRSKRSRPGTALVRLGVSLLTGSCLASGLGGCGTISVVRDEEEARPSLELQELELLVRTFGLDFATVIETTSNRLVAGTEDPGLQRQALVWKMRTISLAQSFLIVEDPRIAFVDLWSLTEQVRLESGEQEWHSDFGPEVVVLTERMSQLNRQIRRIGGTFLTEKELSETEASIESFAANSAIGERFFAYHRGGKDQVALGSFLTGMVTTPLSAFNPFGGVSETAVAIHDVAGSADLVRDAVVQMPDELRWQLELIIHDIRNSPELQRSLTSAETLTKTFEDFAVLAKSMPKDLRGEVEALLAEMDEAQVQLRATLAEVNGTLDKVEPLLESTERVTESVAVAGAALEQTFVAFDASMVTILGTPEAREAAASRKDSGKDSGKKSEPFRILDYAETAESLTQTAINLQALLEELQLVTGGEHVQELTDTLDETTTRVVDHLAIRIAQLLAIATACALLLRVLWGRLGSSRSEA